MRSVRLGLADEMVAARLIEESGLSDEEVAERLNDDVDVPFARAGLVQYWREGRAEPAAAIVDLLADLSPRSALPALARVS